MACPHSQGTPGSQLQVPNFKIPAPSFWVLPSHPLPVPVSSRPNWMLFLPQSHSRLQLPELISSPLTELISSTVSSAQCFIKISDGKVK